jgi:haloacetate dehalogenase
MMEGFTTAEIQTGETSILVRSYGSGPPVHLLHGFRQTHLMWRSVAPLLARNFTVVCADLRGYGLSGCPGSTPDHAPYAKRAMAQDMVAVMQRLGFGRLSVAGHDRGGRVAYRMALDYPDRVDRLAVLDVLPTEAVWEHADARLALAFWPLLAARPTRAAARARPGGGPRSRRRRRARRVGFSL